MSRNDDKPTLYAALAIFVIGLMINIGAMNDTGELKMLTMAVVIVVETIVCAIAGIFFLLNKDTKPVAQGIFIGMGINLVVGFSMCTMSN